MILSKLQTQGKAYSQLTGLLYLIIAIIGGFSIGYMPSVIVAEGNAVLTFQNLMNHQELFRWGIAGDIAVLVLPAGKSGHLELGYMIGSGKRGYILFDDDVEDCRWDVMYQFTRPTTEEEPDDDDGVGVFFSIEELIEELKDKKTSKPNIKALK